MAYVQWKSTRNGRKLWVSLLLPTVQSKDGQLNLNGTGEAVKMTHVQVGHCNWEIHKSLWCCDVRRATDCLIHCRGSWLLPHTSWSNSDRRPSTEENICKVSTQAPMPRLTRPSLPWPPFETVASNCLKIHPILKTWPPQTSMYSQTSRNIFLGRSSSLMKRWWSPQRSF